MVTYDDRPVKVMLYPAIIFMVFGMLVGVYLSFNTFVFPDYFSGEYIHFGRIRPVHVSSVALLWLLSANIGLIYYFVPRLCGIPLWSSKLAFVTAGLWWLGLIVGTFSFPFGTNSGWEYAELPMLLGGWFSPKGFFTISWVLIVINILMTISKRKYKKMYVSLWYTIATLIWTTFVYVAGNFGIEFVPGGISRVNVNFFYVHNLVGLIFTPMGVATAYYFIPKISNTPIYSHKLSMIGFWTISFTYAWIGAHHIIHGPVSQWLQTVSIIFSIWMFIPVWTVVTNFFGTLKDQWCQYTQSVPIRFLMMGTVFYLLVCVQGPLQALRNVNEITSKTDWIIGHAHMALFGAFTFFAIGAIYHVIPTMCKKPLWSKNLAEWHFNLNFLGAFLMFVSLFIGGFMQGLEWAQWATGDSYAIFHRNLTQVSFLRTIGDMWYWWLFRGISGVFILVGNLLFLLNMFNTIILKPRKQPQELETYTHKGES
jgi:cytochrome c oxidase cbb3-type subunit I